MTSVAQGTAKEGRVIDRKNHCYILSFLSSIWTFIKAFLLEVQSLNETPLRSPLKGGTAPGLAPKCFQQLVFIFSALTGHTGCAVSIRVTGGRLSWHEHFPKMGWICTDANTYLFEAQICNLSCSHLDWPPASIHHTPSAEWVPSVCLAAVGTAAEARCVGSLSCVALYCWLSCFLGGVISSLSPSSQVS